MIPGSTPQFSGGIHNPKEKLNQMSQQVSQMAGLRVDSPLEIVQTPGGPIIRLKGGSLQLAKLTAKDGSDNKYAWTPQQFLPDGTVQNANNSVLSGTVDSKWAVPAYGGSEDLTGTYGAIVDRGEFVEFYPLSAGSSVPDAAYNVAGKINTSDQFFGLGQKRFDGSIKIYLDYENPDAATLTVDTSTYLGFTATDPTSEYQVIAAKNSSNVLQHHLIATDGGASTVSIRATNDIEVSENAHLKLYNDGTSSTNPECGFSLYAKDNVSAYYAWVAGGSYATEAYSHQSLQLLALPNVFVGNASVVDFEGTFEGIQVGTWGIGDAGVRIRTDDVVRFHFGTTAGSQLELSNGLVEMTGQTVTVAGLEFYKGWLIGGSFSGGGMSIGGAITGASVPGGVLFQDSSGDLAQSSGITFNDTDDQLTLGVANSGAGIARFNQTDAPDTDSMPVGMTFGLFGASF